MACDEHILLTGFSARIAALIGFIEAHGFSVNFRANSLSLTDGDIDYASRRVSVYTACAGCAVETLIHEAAHMLYYLHSPDRIMPSKQLRERAAEVLRPVVLRKIGRL